MKTFPYLSCKKGIFHFRRVVPLDLRNILLKREILVSLRTSDVKAARKIAVEMADSLDSLFRSIRSGKRLLSMAELEPFVQLERRQKTEALIVEALEDFDSRRQEDEEWEGFHARTFKQEALEDLRYNRLDSSKPNIDKFISVNSLPVERDSAVYKQLCRASLQALVEFYTDAELVIKGDFENPRLQFNIKEDSSIIEGVSSLEEDLTFSQAADQFLEENKNHWSGKYFSAQRARLTHFMSFVSATLNLEINELTLKSVSNSLVRQYKDLLQQTPANAEQKYPDLDPIKRVSAARSDGAKLLSAKSISNNLQSLSGLYAFCIDELDYSGDNPFKGRSKSVGKQDRARDRRSSFSRDQLINLFQSPLFKGCKSLASCHRPGELIPRESHKYWVPLIALYTGMRLQEILQLYHQDVYQKESIWVFDLNENHKDKTLKTSQSHRLVPVHKDLIKLGLLDFIESHKGNKRVFEDASLANDGTYSSTFSKWFSRYLEKVELKTAKTSFHSFRHNLKDFFRQTGESDELAENFMGRTTGTTGEAYGSGFSVQRLNEAIQKISFEDYVSLE